jgi:hypothetical protein
MTDVSYAEALQAEQNDTEQEVTVVNWQDSDGKELVQGDRVYVSEAAEFGYYGEARDFDFGRVDSLNEDGTVNVGWDSAMCGCGGEDTSRQEKSGDLTKTTAVAVALYFKGFYNGQDEGREQFQSEFRELLGLDEALDKLVQAKNDN